MLRYKQIQISQPTLFVPMLDARRQEVWTAVYDAQDQALAPAQPVILEHTICLEIFMAPFLAHHGQHLRLVFSGQRYG